MNISVSELKNRLREVKIIDVRESEEFLDHIEDAENKPLGALIRDLSKGAYNITKDKEIVCYCVSGVRGKIATDFLNNKGFKARNLEGGYAAWKNQG